MKKSLLVFFCRTLGGFFFYTIKSRKGAVELFNPYQPYYTQYAQGALNSPQRVENTLVRVTGLEGAKAYQMPPNSTAALFDGAADYFYIKSTDGAGFPTIKTFRFEPIESCNQVQGEYVTRAEFEELRKELEYYGKQHISESSSKSSKSANGTNKKPADE